jgi:hypothetical protein
MNFLDPYIGAIKGIALLAVVACVLWTGHHFGAQGVQAKWSAAELLRANAEKAAVLARNAQNAADAAKQKADNEQITKAKDEEIDKLRNDLARVPRLRIGSAICGGPATLPKPQAPAAAMQPIPQVGWFVKTFNEILTR